MAKLGHFWKWQIGRFWYFNVSTVPGEKKSCLSGLVQNGQLAPVWLDPSRSESPKTPLNTPKQLWHPKISPKSIETPLQTTKNKKDTNRHQPILPDVFKSSKPTLRHSLKMQSAKWHKPMDLVPLNKTCLGWRRLFADTVWCDLQHTPGRRLGNNSKQPAPIRISSADLEVLEAALQLPM